MQRRHYDLIAPFELPGLDWYSRPELNRDRRFRKPLLYPFELREQSNRAGANYYAFSRARACPICIASGPPIVNFALRLDPKLVRVNVPID